MLDGIRRFMRERFDSVSSRRPEELARSLGQQGQATKEQATRIARDVVEWSRKNREIITDVVQREVRRQMARMGVATREEIGALRKRVRDLEAGRRARKSPAEQASAMKPAAKRAAVKKTAAKTPAKKATARRAGGGKKIATRKPAGSKSEGKRAATRKSTRPARRG